MATQLQIRRGTSSQVAAFTGAEGEIVVNTTNDSVHVNDGSTAGGFELARADLNNVSDTSLNAALTGNTVSALTVTSLTSSGINVTGTVTADGLTVQTTNGLNALLESTTSYQYLQFKNSAETNNFIGFVSDDFVVSPANNQKLIVTAEGNVGIGVTPEAWTVFNPVLQIGGGAIAGSSNTNIRMFSNTYYDGAYKRIATGAVSKYEQADGNHIWYSNPSAAADSTFTPDEHMRLDPSGNVGIGTSSPSSVAKLQVEDITASNTSTYISVVSGNGGNAGIAFGDSDSDLRGGVLYNNADNALRFFGKNAFSEAGRFDSDGNLLVGKTAVADSTVGFQAQPSGRCSGTMASSSGDAQWVFYSTGAGAYRFFVSTAGEVNATSTSIIGISDVSLKENIRDLDKGLETILALQPRRFDWKNGDGNDIMGFVAQEVETVLPELVHDYKYNDEETKLGLKMGDMIPSLVKAIQQQQATIESQAAAITDLTTRLTALENN